jgi:hypothetical protein
MCVGHGGGEGHPEVLNGLISVRSRGPSIGCIVRMTMLGIAVMLVGAPERRCELP